MIWDLLFLLSVELIAVPHAVILVTPWNVEWNVVSASWFVDFFTLSNTC